MLAQNFLNTDEARLLLERGGATVASIAQKYPGGRMIAFFWLGRSPRVWVIRAKARFENFATDVEREFAIYRKAA